jgi:hypothetical protein
MPLIPRNIRNYILAKKKLRYGDNLKDYLNRQSAAKNPILGLRFRD